MSNLEASFVRGSMLQSTFAEGGYLRPDLEISVINGNSKLFQILYLKYCMGLEFGNKALDISKHALILSTNYVPLCPCLVEQLILSFSVHVILHVFIFM